MRAHAAAVCFVVAAGGVAIGACTEEYDNPALRLRPASDASADAELDDASVDPELDAGIASDAAIDTSDGAIVETFLSDLAYVVVENGYGPVEKDTSNGEDAAGDGNTITLEGVTYAKGLGVHARSEITFALNGQYARFISDVGLDDEITAGGSIVFRVLVDGAEIYNSDVMTFDTPTKTVNVDVSGKNTLTLVVDDAGDGIGADHGDWAGARLRK